MSDTLKQEIEKEIAGNTILVYGKGTKDAPRCGFTAETIQFFTHFGYPFQVVDVLENMPKRNELSQMTNWPTLPKIFIAGKFYGDTDILAPMAQNGELKTVLAEAFPGVPEPATRHQPALSAECSRRTSAARKRRGSRRSPSRWKCGLAIANATDRATFLTWSIRRISNSRGCSSLKRRRIPRPDRLRFNT